MVYRDDYPDGVPKTLIFFTRGQVDSIYRLHRNGTASEVLRFRDGLQEGRQVEQYADGSVRMEWAARAGKLDGPFLVWHPNGMAHREIEYRGGEEVFGSRKVWDSAGNPLYSWHPVPEDSATLFRETYAGGKSRMEIRYRKGVYDGATRFWDCEGTPVREEWYERGQWIREISHLTGDTLAVPEEKRFLDIDMKRLPRFDDIYTHFLARNSRLGGDLVMHVETEGRGRVIRAFPVKSTTSCREMDMAVWTRVMTMSLEGVPRAACGQFRWRLIFQPADK